MARAAGSGVAHLDLPGILLHGIQQVLDRLIGRILRHHHDLRVVGDGQDRGEVAVTHLADSHDPLGPQAVRREEQGVAVGFCLQRGLRSHRTGRPGFILHDDRLPQLLFQGDGQLTAHQVRGPARAVRDDHRDALLRVIRCLCGSIIRG